MKNKKNILIILGIVVLVVTMVARLMSNKKSFARELKLISESNGSIPVIVDTVKMQPVHTEFLIDGMFSASKETSIAAELEGKVNAINCYEGDKVTQGQVLATTENDVYKSELELARYNLEKAEKDMQRNQELIKSDGVTMQQFEDAKKNLMDVRTNLVSAQKQYDDSFIRAPFNGIITSRHIETGAYLSPGTVVFDMVKISKVKFVAMVTAKEATQIKTGQDVTVLTDIYSGCYKGWVKTINVKADESGKYNVEILVENSSENTITPGMFGTAVFQGISQSDVLVISRRAIAGSIKDAEVFIVKGDSVVTRKLEIEPLQGDQVLVKTGLKAGDVIVTSGQINLEKGSKIKIL